MATITEDYVSFETAKLLKDKGFNEFTFSNYNENGIVQFTEVETRVAKGYQRPTLQMAMDWLREYHGLWIDIDILTSYRWIWSIWFMNDPDKKMGEALQSISTYKEACEAAIKYCLENLI